MHRTQVTSETSRPAPPRWPRADGSARFHERLDERLAAKARVDGLAPHPLRPRLFAARSTVSSMAVR